MRYFLPSIAVLTLISISACGGETPPPQAPETPAAQPPASPPPAPEASAASTPAETEKEKAEAAPEPPPEPAVVVKSLKFVPAKGSRIKEMELGSDGSIMQAGKLVAKIVNDELQDADGNPIASIAKGGTVSISGSDKQLSFSASDDLERDDGMKVSIAEDGTPTIVKKEKAKPETNLGKFEGFDPKLRRAAALMLALDELKKAAKAAKAAKPAEKAAKSAEKAPASK